MTTKVRTAVGTPDPDDGREPVEVVPSESTVDLTTETAEGALSVLRGAKSAGVRVLWVQAPTAWRSTDQVVVGDHAYDGQYVDGRWTFAPAALEMAARVAGWSNVDWPPAGDGPVRLS